MLREMEVPLRGSNDGNGGQEVLGVAGNRATYPHCWWGQLWIQEALAVYTAPDLMTFSSFPFIPSLLYFRTLSPRA